MGCLQSKQEKTENKTNQMINQQLKSDQQSMKNEVKLLLLGAGESGKSTIIKQMKLIHEHGYSEQERICFTEIVKSNLIVSMLVVLDAMKNLEISLENSFNQKNVDILYENGGHLIHESAELKDSFPTELIEPMKSLWNDNGFKQCVKRSNEFQLNDSAPYLFDSILRITQLDYIPTEEDILRSRVKSTGIKETVFKVGKLNYKMVDVGGQRSERKKWIHCFENVSCIIFLAAINEYDQMLFEDNAVKRLDETFKLFESICNSKWFTNTSIILFLNKIDLLEQKLPTSDFKTHFEDFQGDCLDIHQVCEFMKFKFLQINLNFNKQVYTHFTCATDTNQIKFVMSAVNDIVVQANLRECGLL